MTTFLTSVRTTLTGYLRYRGDEGQISFILHRLTGLGTLLFLAIHILDTATVYYYPSLYEHAIELYRQPIFMIGEMGLVFSVIYHGVNGIRIAGFDLFLAKNWNIKTQRGSVRLTLILSVILWLPTVYIMGRNLIEHL